MSLLNPSLNFIYFFLKTLRLHAVVGVILDERAGAIVHDWIPVKCRFELEFCAKKNNRRLSRRSFACRNGVGAYTIQRRCNQGRIPLKDDWPLMQSKRGNKLIWAGDLNTRVGRLSTYNVNLDDPCGFDSCYSQNEERLLALCSDHELPHASTNFSSPSRQ